MDNYIYETPIYDGGLKEWRILNLNTGSFYCTAFETKEQAEAAISDGESRNNKIVKRLDLLKDVRPLLEGLTWGG